MPEINVTFRGNGGTNAAGLTAVTRLCTGDYNGLPTDFKRNGYDFAGWFTLPFGGGTRVTEGTSFAAAGGVATLHAAWTAKGGGGGADGYDVSGGGGAVFTNTPVWKGALTVDEYVDDGGTLRPVTTIGDRALHGKYQITDVYLPAGITTIEEAAFAHCGDLRNIEIPEALDPGTGNPLPLEIGPMAFAYCQSLPRIVFHGEVTDIGKLAFAECSSLREIWFLGELPTTIGVAAFHGTHPDLKIYYDPAAANKDAFEGLFAPGRPPGDNVFWSDPDISVDTRAANPSKVLEVLP